MKKGKNQYEKLQKNSKKFEKIKILLDQKKRLKNTIHYHLFLLLSRFMLIFRKFLGRSFPIYDFYVDAQQSNLLFDVILSSIDIFHRSQNHQIILCTRKSPSYNL